MVHIIDDRLYMGRVMNTYRGHLDSYEFVAKSSRLISPERADRDARRRLDIEAARTGADIVFIERIEYGKAGFFGMHVCDIHSKLYRFKF